MVGESMTWDMISVVMVVRNVWVSVMRREWLEINIPGHPASTVPCHYYYNHDHTQICEHSINRIPDTIPAQTTRFHVGMEAFETLIIFLMIVLV